MSSFSRVSSGGFSRTQSEFAQARLTRTSSSQPKGVVSQRNELWLKLAKRHVTVPGAEEESDEETKVREQCRLFRHGQQIQDLTFHHEFPIFASCSEDRTVKIWEQNPVSNSSCILFFAWLFVVS